MKKHNSLLEIQVDTGNEEQDRTIHTLLASLSLEELIQRILGEAGISQPVILTLVISDDETIQNLNRQYRQQDKPTDVLSFPLLDKPLVDAPTEQLWVPSEESGGEVSEAPGRSPAFVTPAELPTNLGDIVISWPAVVRQAAEAGHDSSYELLYLLAHGVLHLAGYDDQTEAGYAAMVGIQQHVMEAMGWKAQP